jgi:hypothetical protein
MPNDRAKPRKNRGLTPEFVIALRSAEIGVQWASSLAIKYKSIESGILIS